MKEQSDTPRTDAAKDQMVRVPMKFINKIARERDEALARVSDLVENGERLKAVADSVVRDAADIAEAKCALLRDRIEHQVAEAQNERDEARAEVERLRKTLDEIATYWNGSHRPAETLDAAEWMRGVAEEALAATEPKP